MIKLYQFRRAFGLPNPSPFCMKVETYLRLAELPYESHVIDNPGKAPKGKCPFITDGDKTVADSDHILKYLKATYGDPLAGELTGRQRAEHHALAKMMEERLYFALIYTRWIVPENAAIVRDTFFSTIPKPMRGLIFSVVQRKLKRSLFGQGIARHEVSEIEAFAIEDIDCLAAYLGDQDYFAGEKPGEIDATAHAFVAGTIVPPFKSQIRDAAAGHHNLAAYHDRMMTRVFPEYAS